MYKIPRARFLPYIFTGLLLIAAVWAFTYHANVAVREQVFAKSAEQAKHLADLFEQNVLKIFRYGDTYLMMARRELSRHGEIGAVRR